MKFSCPLLLALALSLLSPLAATSSILPHSRHPHRRFLKEESLQPTRHLLQSCNVCPSIDAARATCSTITGTQLSTVRADLVSKCGSVTFNPSPCCALHDSGQWSIYAACACSDSIPGLNAFVDGAAVLAACGCGPAPPPPSRTAFIQPVFGGNGTSSNVSMAAIYSAVSFSNEGGESSSSGGGGGGTANQGGTTSGSGTTSEGGGSTTSGQGTGTSTSGSNSSGTGTTNRKIQ